MQLPKASVASVFYEFTQLSIQSLTFLHMWVSSARKVFLALSWVVYFYEAHWSLSQMNITTDGRGLIFNVLSYWAIDSRAAPPDCQCGYSHPDAFFNRDVELTWKRLREKIKKSSVPEDNGSRGRWETHHSIWRKKIIEHVHLNGLDAIQEQTNINDKCIAEMLTNH